jgi:hypothetical protein
VAAESTATDFADAAKIANAHLVNGMKICSIAVGQDVFVFGEFSASHAGHDVAIMLQHSQLSNIAWNNFIQVRLNPTKIVSPRARTAKAHR